MRPLTLVSCLFVIAACGDGGEPACEGEACPAACDEAACPAERPVCAPDGSCVECGDAADCGGAACVDQACTPPPPPPARGVDLLFVVDNTSYTEPEQAQLAAALPLFINVLSAPTGALPDLHIGVISTDMGASGAFNVSNCSAAGDDGQLSTGLPQNTCVARFGLQHAFISDLAAADGGRQRNYTDGQMAPLFECLVSLGTGGCGFEQPLAAVRRALEPGWNPGFLRPDAALAIVIVSDEDDCSTVDPTMFGERTAMPGSLLGPFTGFRCFDFGVRCAELDLRTSGPKTACAPRARSPYMWDVIELADEIRATKPAGHVVVTVIAGPATPVMVVGSGNDGRTPALQPSCGTVPTSAEPAIRLTAFAERFGAAGSFDSVCGSFELSGFAAAVSATQR